MRFLVFAATAALLVPTAACTPAAGGSPAVHTPSPTATSSQPVRRGTVESAQTRWRVSVAAVRWAMSFAYAGKHERAGAREQLIVIEITARNIGTVSSRLDWKAQKPVDLVGSDGETYRTRTSFDRPSAGVVPGSSMTEAYVFPTPAGTMPAYVVVTLSTGTGKPSTVDLTLA